MNVKKGHHRVKTGNAWTHQDLMNVNVMLDFYPQLTTKAARVSLHFVLTYPFLLTHIYH